MSHLEVFNFEILTSKTHFEISQLWRFSLSLLEVSTFRFLTFTIWSFNLGVCSSTLRFLTSKVIFGSFRFLSLSRRRRLFELLDKQLMFFHWQLLLYMPSEDDNQSQLSFFLSLVGQPITVQHGSRCAGFMCRFTAESAQLQLQLFWMEIVSTVGDWAVTR